MLYFPHDGQAGSCGYSGRSGGPRLLQRGSSSKVSSIAVGQKPWAVAVNANIGRLYSANEYDSTISVADLNSGKVIATLPSGTNPLAIAVNRKTGSAYVANFTGNDVTVIGSDDKVAATISVGATPWDVTVDEDANRVYVANSEDGTVSVIDGATNTVVNTITGFSQPWGVIVFGGKLLRR